MIYVNSHEPEEIVDNIRNEVQVKTKNFSPGDYLIGNIGIERKTMNDFFCSLVNTRLFSQLQSLKNYYATSLLIIETYDPGFFKNSNVIYGAILRIILDMHIKVIFCQTKKQTSEVLVLIHNREKNKKINPRVLKHRLKYRIKKNSVKKNKKHLLKSIPDIGDKKSEQLLRRFRTVKDVLKADEKSLMEVPGIGKKTIENIKRI
ncbi:hypothetical protein GF327_05850 [Candidatus Woesearchaeota archaeon]|nr:hypothetical protein [Candidatus Woesearchaeota archaeon]